MKTLVIQLDHSEDIGSIRDKVTWGKSSRVLLVWPVNYSVFDRKVDLVTIKRICTSQGSRLGIVCDDPVVCAQAVELQIPVFDSISRAMRKGWDRRRRKRMISSPLTDSQEPVQIEDLRIVNRHENIGTNPSRILRILLLVVGILSVLLLVLFLLPSASIRLYPTSQAQEINVEFQVDSQESGASNPGILHGSVVKTTIEGEVEKQTTGSTPAADKKAEGQISITNRTKDKIEVPAQTIVMNNLNPPSRYLLLQSVTIPPGETVTGSKIEAIYAGTNGNSAENTVTRIDGEIGLKVELTNPEPISGGSDRNIPAPSAEDLQALHTDLQNNLKNVAEKQFSSKLEADEILLPSSIKAGEVISETISPEIGQVGTSVRLNQKVEFSALVIHHSNLRDQAEALLAANRIPTGWVISKRTPVAVQILSQKFDEPTNSVKMQTRITGRMIPVIDINPIRKIITGRSRGLAEAIINSQVMSEKPVEIETWPFWLPYIPWLESRITIIIP